MRKIIAIIAVGIMFSGLASIASAEQVFTRGGGTCANWLKTRANNSTPQFMGWLEGYMSGLAVGNAKDILKGTDFQTVFLWMDSYCKNNPMEDVADGGSELYFELVKKKSL